MITINTPPPKAMPPQAPRRAAPGPTAAAVALTVRAPQAPRRAVPGPTAAAVALTVKAILQEGIAILQENCIIACIRQ